MPRIVPIALVGALALIGAACSDTTTTPSQNSLSVDAAFISTPTGFSAASSSYSGDSTSNDTTRGYRHGGRGGHRDGDGCGANGLLAGFDFMGGGLGLDFLGGHGGRSRPFDFSGTSGSCTTANNLTTCTNTRNGLTVTRVLAFTNASGTAQAAYDSTTNTVRVQTRVTGSTTRRDSVTAVVSHSSDQTVSGLASGSTQRKVSGTSSGTENLSGRDSAGVAFTAVRVIGDTIVGIVIPVQNGRPTYPTAGTVTRSLRVSLTSGSTTTNSTRREVISYDGSNTAKVVITKNGTSQTCSLPLPHGRLTCQ